MFKETHLLEWEGRLFPGQEGLEAAQNGEWGSLLWDLDGMETQI